MRTRSGRAAAQKAAAHTSVNGGGERHTAEATPAGSWLVLGKDGRLTAYARGRAGLLRWTQTRPGGAQWTGPDVLPAPDLTDIHIVQGADTYVHFLGRREVEKADGPPAVDIVHAIQYQTGRPVSEWRSLGNPHKDRQKAARFGMPTGAVSANGTVHVFARNAGGGVMLRRELPGGKWGPWTDLKGSLVQDPVAVVSHASGHVEAMVGGQDLIMRWTQDKPGGDFRQAPTIPLAVLRGSAVGLETAPDRATYYWTDPATGGIVAHRPGGWVIPLGGAPAEGPVAVLRVPLDGYDCTVLAHRDIEGQVMLAACGTENEQAGLWWSPTGERCVGAPALARDAYGRVVLGVIGAEGALRIATQNDEGGLALAPSVRV
ncbi:hypothetical protein Sipo8835_08930 [Streptomyces ipomoeae]|uniref:Uncharacterized protein n=2 Tax=Streptomyces ipomoeae TaxID=103232 RepID=L1KSV7_9ACTN|nr:hypothetical protein [Streptomyces ipomoeae]EKX63717.1 hypothetical protein STRIP9103_07721 [Streptomyces ipomoeae 91-03]MDX2700391.1 hypothetical protein [Streptomyces ipomoeae]MDX2828062.1 hypothetical protein [Streptomyces ipomoeae]MDX2840390.1 hypothetical protein [Streptomyces ipomoeae]MDX2880588.1 hypothetical protein [Streptomyces ipomoeae]